MQEARLRRTSVGWAKARSAVATILDPIPLNNGGHAEPVIGPRFRADPLALPTLIWGFVSQGY